MSGYRPPRLLAGGRGQPRLGHPRRFHGWPGAVGRPWRSMPLPLIGAARPNCSAVTAMWCASHRLRVLLSTSWPPLASGVMWSTCVANWLRPSARQCSHSPSVRSSRRARALWPARPRTRRSSPHRCHGFLKVASRRIFVPSAVWRLCHPYSEGARKDPKG